MATPILPLLTSHRERLETAYLARVIKRDGCWGWAGSKYAKGYGKFSYAHGKHIAAHRFSFALHLGIEPGDLLVCHRCDNPECSNPDHLFLGTPKDNSTDMVSKGRADNGDQRRASNNRARLSEEDVASIKTASAAWMANTELGRLYGVHHATISAIKRGLTWRG